MELLKSFYAKNSKLLEAIRQGASPKKIYHIYYEPGKVIQHMDGRTYQVAPDGSWRRVKQKITTEVK